MSAEPELEAMGQVLAALQPLDPHAQTRVIRWVAEKLQLGASFEAAVAQQISGTFLEKSKPPQFEPGAHQLSSAASTWIQQNGVTFPALESVFHLEGTEVTVIAAHIPGNSNREKVLNCYILAGVGEFLRTGNPVFTDKYARSLCHGFGCLDTTNHTKFLSEKGNEFTGSKDQGWTLTAPGKKRGAVLIKEIASMTP
jgi:hypothetical protein